MLCFGKFQSPQKRGGGKIRIFLTFYSLKNANDNKERGGEWS